MTPKRIFITSLLAISLYSCNDSEKNAIAALTDSTSVKVPSQNELKLLKIGIITKNFNDYSVSAYKTYNDYVSTFGNDPENFEPDEISDFSIINDYQVRSLNKLDSAIAISVLTELDPLIRSYKVNSRAFAVTINSCKAYYTKKEYKKDNYDKGGVLHKLTLEIYGKFINADSLLREKSEKISIALEKEYLNTIKKEGPETIYLSILGKNEAKKLNSLLVSSKYEDLRVEELKRLLDAIVKINSRLTIIKETDKGQFDERMSSYYSDFGLLIDALEELYIRKNEKKQFSKKEIKKLGENEIIAHTVEGSPNKVIYRYIKLLESYDKKVVEKPAVYVHPSIEAANEFTNINKKIPTPIE